MKALIALVAALLASVVLYLGLFAVVRKPLTVDVIVDAMTFKRAAAEAYPAPRLFVLAGSNGRFSHRCAAMEPLLDRPCINLSIAAGIGWEFVLAGYRDLFRPGDAIYMPLEYDQYALDTPGLRYGPDNAIIFQRRRDLWDELGASRVLRAIGGFDLAFLLRGSLEMTSAWAGVEPRFSVKTLTRNGDESGHTQARGSEHAAYLRRAQWTAPESTSMASPSAARTVFAGFIGDMVRHDVMVIGGLPTTFDDVRVDDRAVATVRDFFLANEARFVELDNRSQYPRRCFYDSWYHLNEEAQIEHSRRLVDALRPVLEPSGVSVTGG